MVYLSLPLQVSAGVRTIQMVLLHQKGAIQWLTGIQT